MTGRLDVSYAVICVDELDVTPLWHSSAPVAGNRSPRSQSELLQARWDALSFRDFTERTIAHTNRGSDGLRRGSRIESG